MGKYRSKKPVEAVRWFKNGDHPEDNSCMVGPDPESTTQFAPYLSEGKVVRYYRTLELDGQVKCKQCNAIMHGHGRIGTPEEGRIVCPGDWIIKEIRGEYYPLKPDVFEATYEEVPVGNFEGLDDKERKAVHELNETTMNGWDDEANLIITALIAERKKNIDLKLKLTEVTKDRDHLEGLVHVNERLNLQIIDLKFKLARAELRVYGKNNKLKQRIAELEEALAKSKSCILKYNVEPTKSPIHRTNK